MAREADGKSNSRWMGVSKEDIKSIVVSNSNKGKKWE